jgi:hypothetical protein
MTTTTKIFVVLAFVAAILFEAYLTFVHQGVSGPAIVKTVLVIAFLYYGISRIVKAKSGSNTQQPPDQN